MKAPSKRKFDLLIVVPLEEELIQIQKIFPHKTDLSDGGCYISEVDTECDLTAVTVLQEEMGKSAAARAVDEAVSKFNFDLIVCIGIAGAISGDLHLCDVCYSGNILDVLDNSKASDGDDGGMSIALSPTHYFSPKQLSTSFDYIRRLPDLREQYEAWQHKCSDTAQSKIEQPVPSRNGKTERIAKPKSLKGTIACGAVSQSEGYNKKLKSLDRKVLAIETESGGIFERADRYGIPAITIRGISDYADPSKGELEDETAGHVRELAALNAASFLKLQLNNPNFQRQISTGADSTDLEADANTSGSQTFDIPKLIEQTSKKIEEKLRDLAPEYKLLPKGFVLPLPRVRRTESGLGRSEEMPLVEIRECLASEKNIYLAVARGYPEKSLAWLIADELVQSDLNGVQLLPIVVEGEQVKPPHNSIEAAAPEEINFVSNGAALQPVIIFDGVPLNSKTRMDFIIDQVRLHPGAKFIFVDRTSSNLFFEGEFEVTLGAEPYEVCEISFSQMSHFVQKNFDMTSSEADVIALRLRNTFHKFNLPAHPTYFAGIPRSTLASLIQANRRAELMDLAVVGFMSFVVADDKSPVQLSRTTRTRFLQKLIVEMWVEKSTFNEAELVNFTRKFAAEFDFEISPIQFINDFVENGILHFENGRASISLPFVEHYLLAAALVSDEDLAKRYFDLNAEDFDYETFDLYAEIGPSHKIVDSIVTNLTAAVESCNDCEKGTSVFWDGEVDKIIKIKRRKVDSIHKKVEEAIRSIREDNVETDEKQQMLDASDRVRMTIAERQKAEREENTGEEDSQIDEIGVLAKLWTIGVFLLGSGAEHLNANKKRELASKIVRGLEALVDDWTRFHLSMDFEDMRADLTSDRNIDEFIRLSPGTRTHDEVKTLFGELVDALQYMLLSTPLHRILGFVCEHARASVLSPSISQSKVEGDFQEFMKAVWLSDVSAKKGKGQLVEAMKKIPNAPFFRTSIAMHFLTRVYWNHALKSERLMMLDHADAILRPTRIPFGKQELKRMIEKDSKTEISGEDIES